MIDQSADKDHPHLRLRSHSPNHGFELIGEMCCRPAQDGQCNLIILPGRFQDKWSKRGKIEFLLIDRGNHLITGVPPVCFGKHLS